MANELANITFIGEEEAACGALRWFGVYARVDMFIRRLAREKKYAEAVALCTGAREGSRTGRSTNSTKLLAPPWISI